MITLNSEFWNKRYLDKETGWDIGYVSTPIKEYFNQVKNKELKILIPGGGNSYEAEFLFNKGFTNTFLLDYAITPLINFQRRNPKFPSNQLIHRNFFDYQDNFDIIVEQTFFCAINPKLRKKYSEKCNDLLNKKGKIIGLLFDDKLNNEKPPFGGSKKEYKIIFKNLFNIKKMEACKNSIPQRLGKELFINLEKKQS